MPPHIDIHPLPDDLNVVQVLRRFADEEFVVLLDSAVRNPRSDARYSFLTADPVDVCSFSDGSYGCQPFEKLRDWSKRLSGPVNAKLPPFFGGIAGLMAYELGHCFERLPLPRDPSLSTPLLIAGLFDWAIVWDHQNKTTQLYVLSLDGLKKTDASDCRTRAQWVKEKLQAEPATHQPQVSTQSAKPLSIGHEGYPLPGCPGVYSNFTADDYVDAAARVIEYIRAGDIFQANLSQQLSAEWHGTAVELYEHVRTHNPAPFGGLLQVPEFAVVSASPERFLHVTDGRFVQTRPIKGTRRRHRDPIADLYTGSELVASEKDRAENVMIVDLLRNDLSRVCQPGSVRVTGVCEVEVFETVQHLVSTIVGQLQPERDVWDLCAAAIPGGSITGAPKIRAMEIIAELEPTTRGAYCGNLFYLGPAGTFDSNLLIRTFTLRDGCVRFPVGGGIVADSQPRDEYKETLHKAAAMLNCLGHRLPLQNTETA